MPAERVGLIDIPAEYVHVWVYVRMCMCMCMPAEGVRLVDILEQLNRANVSSASLEDAPPSLCMRAVRMAE